MSETTVVVHGATGTQGTAIIRRLRAAGHRIRAVARHPRLAVDPAVEAVPADLLDLDALVAAYAGADAVVIQLPLHFAADAVRQADTVLGALGKTGVPRAVFNTGGALPTDPVGMPFVDARIRLAARLPDTVPVASVVGPASTYLENLVAAWSRPLVHTQGELRYPMPEQLPNPWLAADDLGAVVADLVVAAAPPTARFVAGPSALTGPQVAAEIEAATGRRLRWHTIDPQDYARMLAPHLGEAVASGIAAAYINPAPLPDPTLVVRGTTTVRAWAARQDWAA
ncbi:NAD(P)H-binding protein [Micromonospora sp. KC213]|uniref:SDR family oxidoreductase n=1 Tax=Micromonospora sp. KC213 TaxID=2530378 RepID=UPI001052007C|nr:NAD(P)H-binding protein [Micromonospora sp. KC213]TDC43869.1 NAD-dependent epimerase/dehydratase family protein [Micromonospora sp. KC213]